MRCDLLKHSGDNFAVFRLAWPRKPRESERRRSIERFCLVDSWKWPFAARTELFWNALQSPEFIQERQVRFTLSAVGKHPENGTYSKRQSKADIRFRPKWARFYFFSLTLISRLVWTENTPCCFFKSLRFCNLSHLVWTESRFCGQLQTRCVGLCHSNINGFQLESTRQKKKKLIKASDPASNN